MLNKRWELLSHSNFQVGQVVVEPDEQMFKIQSAPLPWVLLCYGPEGKHIAGMSVGTAARG